MAGFRSIEVAKSKITAVAIANEKMEEIRNMPYDSLATAHGLIYPPGTIADDVEIVRKGIKFNVHTVISYIDDPFDLTALTTPGVTCNPSENDCYPYDYKKAEITVSKVGSNGFLSRVTSSVAAKAAETPSNTGIIYICVVDEASNPVVGADVSIQNSGMAPPVDISGQTNNNGCIMVPNLPPDSHNGYHLTATKSGYSSDSTSPRTPQNPHATCPDVNVMIQQITSQTLTIDRLGKMALHLVDDAGNPVVGASIKVEGAKEPYSNPPTKKYSQDFVSDSSGDIAIYDLEFDSYSISVSGWDIVSASPYQPVQLRAGDDLETWLILTQNQALPMISLAEPSFGNQGTNISITITGKNFEDGAAAKLIDQTGVEVIGTNVVVSKQGQTSFLDADFNLVEVVKGLYDIVIINLDGSSVRQKKGFEVR